MKQRYFVTGTDTGIGKTTVAGALLRLARQQGLSTLGLKPIASDARWTEHGLVNDDALCLHSESTCSVSLTDINPYVFAPAIAPHIAAQLENTTLTIANIMAKLKPALQLEPDLLLCEGAGGWLVPLNLEQPATFADLACALNYPVILIVGLKLGCINHALLTAQAIAASGLTFAGWISNHVDPDMAYVAENIDTLSRLLPAPCFGHVPFIPDAHDRLAKASIHLQSILTIED